MRPAASAPARPRAARAPAAERRRELALAAAGEFHRHGFHRVTLGGVAAAVGLSAPAVYRHFANKNALLAGAVDTGIEEIAAALDLADREGGSPDAVLRRLTEAALRRPDFWTLSQREARYLDDDGRRHVRERFRALTDRMSAVLGGHDPGGDPGRLDVLVTATLAVLSTPSTHHTPLPAERVATLLTEASRATLAAVDEPGGPGPTTPGAPAASERAAQILETAFGLFHRHGYAAVSLDDIGAAVGIAGPSIYHHYGSKAELLVAAFDRVLDGLPRIDRETEPDDAVRAYVDLALREREAVATRTTEIISLPSEDAARIGRALADDLAAWTAMLRRDRPDLTGAEAALLVDAARSAVHDVVRLGPLHRRPRLRDELSAIALAVLWTRLPD